MFERTIIKRSGQWWKALASIFAVLGGASVMFLGLALLQRTPSRPLYSFSALLSLGGLFIGILGFAFACVSIRCGSCGARWVWLAITQHSPAEWLAWLLTQSHCPACASGPDR